MRLPNRQTLNNIVVQPHHVTPTKTEFVHYENILKVGELVCWTGGMKTVAAQCYVAILSRDMLQQVPIKHHLARASVDRQPKGTWAVTYTRRVL